MQTEVDLALQKALKNLITQVTRNGQLNKFSPQFQRKRQYDQYEKDYVENQRLRKQLGNQYESSDSQEEKENYFNKMSQYELKTFMRKKLIEKNFDPSVLTEIVDRTDQEQEVEDFVTVKVIGEQTLQANTVKNTAELNIICQARQLVEDEEDRDSNFALEFLITELERIERQGKIKC